MFASYIIAEFRQAWINDQRKDVAEYIGLSRRWVELYEQHNDARKDGKPELADSLFKQHFDLTNEALAVLWRVKMRMNPLDNSYKNQDENFLTSLDDLIDPAKSAPHPVNPLRRSGVLSQI